MSLEEPEKNPANFLGIPTKEPTKTAPVEPLPSATNQNPAPTTAWEIYNNRAIVFDRELIKDWNASLNTLLVFAALYSAVVTAFIIESMTMLQEDPAEITRDALLAITKQLANQSTSAYERPPFQVPPYALRVNAYFFTSIVLSLIAALGAVLALQWVNSYDFGLNQSSAKDRALQRHFRFMGIEDWKMAEMIAFLPTLLFISLFLFLTGLADWLFQIHRTIAAVIIFGVGFAVIFYTSTTILAIHHVDSPFQTPVSKSIPLIYQTIIHYGRRSFDLLLRRNRDKQMAPGNDYLFTRREELAIRHKRLLEVNSLLWIVNSVDVVPHTRNAFKTLLSALMEVPTEQLLDKIINKAPWTSVFKLFCQPYLDRSVGSDYTIEELRSEDLLFTLRAIAMVGDVETTEDKTWNPEKFLEPLYYTIPLDESADAYVRLALWRQGYTHLYLPSSIESVVRHIHVCPMEFSKLALTVYHGLQLRDLESGSTGRLFDDTTLEYMVLEAFSIDISDIMTVTPVLPDLLDILLDMLGSDMTRRIRGNEDPLQFYLSSFSEAQSSGLIQPGSSYHSIHVAIRRQYLARLGRMDVNIESARDMIQFLAPIYNIISSSTHDMRIEIVREVLTLLTNTTFKPKLKKLQSYSAISDRKASVTFLMSLVFFDLSSKPNGASSVLEFDDLYWANWLSQIGTICDRHLQSDVFTLHEHLLLVDLYCEALGSYSHYIRPDDYLHSVQSPYVAFSMWVVSGFSDDFPAIQTVPLEAWNGPIWDQLSSWSINYYADISRNETLLGIIRATLVNGSPKACSNLVQFILRNGWPPESTILQSILTPPQRVEFTGDVLLFLFLGLYDSIPWLLQPSSIRGFVWLEKKIAASGNISACVTLIIRAMCRAESFLELAQWAALLSDTLRRPVIGEETIPGAISTDALESILSEQLRERSEDVLAATETSRYQYVRDWSDLELEEWQAYFEGLIQEVKEGYVTEYLPRMARDPDGRCSGKFAQDIIPEGEMDQTTGAAEDVEQD